MYCDLIGSRNLGFFIYENVNKKNKYMMINVFYIDINKVICLLNCSIYLFILKY